MAGASTDIALTRIEAALTRIENAASRAAQALPPAPLGADDDLAMRHEHLRGAVAQSLRQLDDLLARHAA